MRDVLNTIVMVIGFLLMVCFVGYVLVGCEVKAKEEYDVTETNQNNVKELIISTDNKERGMITIYNNDGSVAFEYYGDYKTEHKDGETNVMVNLPMEAGVSY